MNIVGKRWSLPSVPPFLAVGVALVASNGAMAAEADGSLGLTSLEFAFT